uniref:Xylose isomerase-like TIM barrel domain-containing protein n=1 Tax=viral metagenome TaxID=1070528 RepID=A0A6C0EMV4_9ZZZZ
MIIGAHISRETTIIKTMEQITMNGGNALQIFTSNPRSLNITNYDKYLYESHLIKRYCKINKFFLIVHSPYAFNIAKHFISGKKQLEITDTIVFNDLITANIIGAVGYVIHVGKSTTGTIQESLLIMKNNIKNIINEMIIHNIKTILLLETPAGQGTELLKDFTDFLNFYYSFTSDERKLFKICIDTCHIWNAGYELNEIVSLIPDKDDILCIHLNNSKNIKGANVDRHEYLFEGKIHPPLLKEFVKNFDNSIIIIEKPSDEYKKEISYISNI